MELKTLFKDIADAIREKDGTTEPIPASDFPERIRGLTCSGNGDVNIFGVVWDYSSPSSALTRLTPETDPYGLVTAVPLYEPLAQIGAQAGRSPFDSYMPWAGMEEYNVDTEKVLWKKGNPNFSRTEHDTVVYIPKFYYQVVDDAANSKRYWYVSNKETPRMKLHPGSDKYIGRYFGFNDGTRLRTISGKSPLVSKNVTDMRAICRNGKQYMVDYKVWSAVQLLYLVEFANFNSQKMICSDVMASKTITGNTDGMGYHTGMAEEPQYRGIEAPFGVLGFNCNGVMRRSPNVYIQSDPDSYASTLTGDVVTALPPTKSDSYAKTLLYDGVFDYLFLCSETGGSATTYVCDIGSGSNDTLTRAILLGGHIDLGHYNGMFTSGTPNVALSYTTTSCRIMFDPSYEVTQEAAASQANFLNSDTFAAMPVTGAHFEEV